VRKWLLAGKGRVFYGLFGVNAVVSGGVDGKGFPGGGLSPRGCLGP